MNHFTIKDIENLSGIKAHTLRIWEHRYKFLIPKRKESNHRFYDNDDLKQILRVSYLYHSGIKISKIANLQSDAIEKILLDKTTDISSEFFVGQLMEASIDFDEEKFENTLTAALEHHNFENLVLNVVYPFLTKIGLLWITEHIIPAQEHFSSNIIRRKLIAAIDGLPPVNDAGKKTILLFTPQNEHHEIPLLFIHYLLKKNGNKVIYFGNNIPVSYIELYCKQKKVTHLYFHLITNFIDKELDQYILDLAKTFTDQQIVMSGSAVDAVKVQPDRVRLLYSLDDMLNYTRE